MVEMTQQPTLAGTRRRVLGLDSTAVALAMLALLITASILLFQAKYRVGQFEPETVPIFYRLFLFEDYPASFLFIASLLLAAIPGVQQAAASLVLAIGKHPVATSLCSLVAFTAGALWAYHAYPLSMDEAAPYMQAKIFAAGALAGQHPPALLDLLVVPNFQNYFIHVSKETGEIASSYWPGFALLMTPFMAIDAPWLCNPVLGAASVWVIHRITHRVTGSAEAAGAAALFALASAAFVVNSFSFYSMTAHLLCNGVFALLLMDLTPRRVFAAGLVGGLALTLHNPVPHMLFAAPWLVWLLANKNRWTLVAAVAAGYLPWIVIVGFGWHHFLSSLTNSAGSVATAANGSPLGTALNMLSNTFTLPGLQQLVDRVIGLAKFWLWAAPLSVLIAALGFWRNRTNMHCTLLFASFVLTFVGFLFVPLSQGHGWGFRYLHSAWFVLPVLAGAAMVPTRETAVAGWAKAAALGGLCILVPYFAWQVHSFIGSHLAQMPTSKRGEPKVVIVSLANGYYSQDLVQNDPFLRQPVLYLVSYGRKVDEQMMAERFPDYVLLSRDLRGSVWGLVR